MFRLRRVRSFRRIYGESWRQIWLAGWCEVRIERSRQSSSSSYTPLCKGIWSHPKRSILLLKLAFPWWEDLDDLWSQVEFISTSSWLAPQLLSKFHSTWPKPGCWMRHDKFVGSTDHELCAQPWLPMPKRYWWLCASKILPEEAPSMHFWREQY